MARKSSSQRAFEQMWKQSLTPKYIGWTGLGGIVLLALAGQGGSVVIASLIDLGWVLGRAPSVCGAVKSGGGLCAANSKGLLLGCSTQQHREQRVGTLLTKNWPEVRAHLLRNKINTSLAALCAITLILGAIEWVVGAIL